MHDDFHDAAWAEHHTRLSMAIAAIVTRVRRAVARYAKGARKPSPPRPSGYVPGRRFYFFDDNRIEYGIVSSA
ncbi:MAG: hypothetical protein WC729_16600 [Sphingomonas sp.]|jgi:hypothetical protein|uniref:hypothetical protein n=1 Tax=Sphingomonas sp. TaxID=28214 RepID=UPI00356990DE